MQRKAQAVMETLIIYGVIAMVLMAGLGALVMFGVFKPGGMLPDRCTLPEQGLECSEWQISTSGIGMGIMNRMRPWAEVTSFEIRSQNANEYLEDSGGPTTFCNISLTGTDAIRIVKDDIGAILMNGSVCRLNEDYVDTQIKLDYGFTYHVGPDGIDQQANGELRVRGTD